MTKNAEEQYEQMELLNLKKCQEQIEKQLENTSLQDAVEVDFNAQYVQLSLNGALLFESVKADVMEGGISGSEQDFIYFSCISG